MSIFFKVTDIHEMTLGRGCGMGVAQGQSEEIGNEPHGVYMTNGVKARGLSNKLRKYT